MAEPQHKLDLWGTPAQIDWRTSQRIVVLSDLAAVLPIRLELARIEVPIAAHLIVRRVWQLMTLTAVIEEPLIFGAQDRQVKDPSWLALQLFAGDAPRWNLVWRRFDDDRDIPPFPEDTPAPFDVLEVPIEGWSNDNRGNFLFPWGVDAEQRIQVPGQGALSLYVDLNEEAPDSLAAVGGMLQGECRPIIDTPDFRAWFGRR